MISTDYSVFHRTCSVLIVQRGHHGSWRWYLYASAFQRLIRRICASTFRQEWTFLCALHIMWKNKVLFLCMFGDLDYLAESPVVPRTSVTLGWLLMKHRTIQDLFIKLAGKTDMFSSTFFFLRGFYFKRLWEMFNIHVEMWWSHSRVQDLPLCFNRNRVLGWL